MKKKYIKPNIAKYGECKTLIQGDCGWGMENITLDKTGYSKKKWRKWVAQPCAGANPNGSTNCYSICTATTVCSNKHECSPIGAKKKIS